MFILIKEKCNRISQLRCAFSKTIKSRLAYLTSSTSKFKNLVCLLITKRRKLSHRYQTSLTLRWDSNQHLWSSYVVNRVMSQFHPTCKTYIDALGTKAFPRVADSCVFPRISGTASFSRFWVFEITLRPQITNNHSCKKNTYKKWKELFSWLPLCSSYLL